MTNQTFGKGTERKALFLVFCMMLAIVPLTHAGAEDIGNPSNLQAQDINAVFDPASETTSITWRNIDFDGSVLSGLFSATYSVYRSADPINQTSIVSLSPFVEGIVACSLVEVGNDAFKCRGLNGTVDYHTASFLVPPGVNGSFHYAVTTTLDDGTELLDLDENASTTAVPVQEITTPIRTPYNLIASFNPEESVTTLTWVNYNDIFPILPEVGDDAYQINIWRTDYPITRSNGADMVSTTSPVATFPAGTSSVELTIPMSTDRDAYYAVTYFLPNWTGPGQNYEDVRFLSNNALSNVLVEDNMPPSQVSIMYGEFIPNAASGGGITTISWTDVPDEVGESYRIYMSGNPFYTILSPSVQLIATVSEGVGSFDYEVPIGRLGYANYCLVTVDLFGVFDTNTTLNSCAGPIFEDAFTPWIAEPTQVHAEFIGERTTRVTWQDQLGVEGERYHIWRSNFRVTGAEFVANQSMEWLGSVSDGVGFFDVLLDGELLRDNAHYYVTTEALYGHINGSYMDTRLNQNHFGPISEDTRAPNPARIKEAASLGSFNQITLEWFNEPDMNEGYEIWRHYGAPFGVNEDQIGEITDAGWEFVQGDISPGESTVSTIVRQLPIPDGVDREVWYAVIIEDQWGNQNPEMFNGIGGNAVKVIEDTKFPIASMMLLGEDGAAFLSPSLVSGSYVVQMEIDEYLQGNPSMNITTIAGGDISGGEVEMNMIADNNNDPDRGPVYAFEFFISPTTIAGDMVIEIIMEDESNNVISQTWTDRAVDAMRPSVEIYAPSSGDDGSQYLYGNSIQLLAGATDDVMITSFQYKFTYDYGTGNSQSTPWSEATSVTDLEGDNRSMVLDMEFSAGNFEPGQHAVYVRAVDSAGNEISKSVVFVVDQCRNRLDGTTSCNYVESLKDDPEPIVIKPSLSSPPYVLVWVLSGLFVASLIVMALIIKTSMSGPKKKKSKGDEEEEDDDWMSEFIGTSQDLDMDSVTNTSSEEKKEEEKKQSPPAEAVEEDDPFAVNLVQRKTRDKKAAVKEEEDDEDDDMFNWNDDDDDEEEEEPAPVAKKRTVGRRAAPRKAPTRRKVGRSKKDD
jgi:flagellar basal body-associated protein FliL